MYVITLDPLTFKCNDMVDCRTFLSVMRSAAAIKVLSLHVNMRYMTRSSTSPNKLSPITEYAENPSDTRSAENQRRECVTVEAFQKHGVTC